MFKWVYKLLNHSSCTHTHTAQRQWLLKAEEEKASSEALPAPNHRCCRLPYFLVNLSIFEWTLFGIITLNGACTIAELATTDTLAAQVLEYINYVFVAIYIVEAFLKAPVISFTYCM